MAGLRETRRVFELVAGQAQVAARRLINRRCCMWLSRGEINHQGDTLKHPGHFLQSSTLATITGPPPHLNNAFVMLNINLLAF